LSEVPIKKLSLVKRVPVRRDRGDFYLFKAAETKLAETLLYRPYYTDKNWSAAVNQWFESPDPKILVKAKDLPLTVAASTDTVKVLEEKIFPARLKLKVAAKENIPILVKIAYFPRWQAYVEGKPLKIYQVAPSFMLIYGKGEIELKYTDAPIDRLGKILTLVGIGWLLLEVFALPTLSALRRASVKLSKPA